MSRLCVILLLLPFFTYGQNENKTADWGKLDQPEYTITYPASWSLDQKGQMGTSFVLFSPLESAQDIFRENINLLIQDLTGYNLDLDKYTELSEKQVKTVISNSVLIESVRIKTDSTEYHQLFYTGTQGIYHLKFQQYYWVINNKAYILTFTSEQGEIGYFDKTGKDILNSFAIKK